MELGNVVPDKNYVDIMLQRSNLVRCVLPTSSHNDILLNLKRSAIDKLHVLKENETLSKQKKLQVPI